MTTITRERLDAATGLVGVLAVSGAVLLSALSGQWQLTGVWAISWWLIYGTYVVVYLLNSELVGGRQLVPERTAAIVLLASGLTVWFLDPSISWVPTLFVVTAATSAYAFRNAALLTCIVVAQSLATLLGTLTAGYEPGAIVALPLAYASFQAFAVVVIRGTQREQYALVRADEAHRELQEAHQELRAAHAELRTATALLAAGSRDAERLRISRDLHDGLGHQLTALTLQLEIANHQIQDGGAECVARARGMAKDMLTELRATVGELRAEPQGLDVTLRGLLDALPGLEVRLVVDIPDAPTQATSLVVARAVQEIATNTMRHAHAQRLDVEVAQSHDGSLTVRAQDDGHGITRVVPGHGLRGMSERVAALGGNVEFSSAPGRGFGVVIDLPAHCAQIPEQEKVRA